jgi:phage-related protein
VALNIGELVGYLKLDRKQWNAGITAARAQLKRLGAGNDDLNQMQSRISKVGNGFKMAALQAGNLQWVIFGIAGALQLIGASSGVLGLAVGGVAALAAVAITAKLGADGIKKAFEGLNPTLDTLKAKVSSSFQSTLVYAVNDLKGVLPQLTSGFQQIASAIGGVAGKFTTMLKSGAAVAQLQAILSGTARIVQNLGKAVAPIGAAFLRVAAVAIPILVQLTGGAGAAAEKFNAWVQRMADAGKITQWIQNALNVFKELGSYLGGVVALVVHIFDALQQGAGATSMSIDGIVGALIGLAAVVTGNPVLAFIGFLASTAIPILQQFMKTAEGQEVFRQLGDAMNRIGNVVSSVLVTAVMALAPLIPPLVSAFADLAEQALPPLIAAITFLAPVLLNIATFIQQNIDWIGPLATALGVWTAAQWLLNIALDANPIGLIIIAIGALIAIVALIITYWEPISGFFVDLWNTIWKWTSDRITDITNFIVSVWGGIVDWFKGLGAKIGAAFTSVIDWFAALPGKIGAFLASLPGILWDGFTSAFQFALNAVIQGIEWVIAEVIALPFQIAYALFGLGQLLWQIATDAWNAFVDSAKTIGAALIEWVLALPGRIYDGLVSMVLGLGNLARDAWNAFVQSAKDGGVAIYQFALSLPSRIISGISALGSMLSNAASSAWNWFINTMRSTAEGIWSFVQSIPGRIWDTLGNLGNLLYQAGRNIIQGLINGIKAAAGAVYDAVDGILSKVRNLLPFSPAKEGPFSGRGWTLYSGMSISQALADGITAKGGEAVRAANDVANRVQAAFGDTIAGSVSSNTTGVVAAAKEILDQLSKGGQVFEDFSFNGSSANANAYNDQLLRGMKSDGIASDGGPAAMMDYLRQFLTQSQNRAMVQIENYHPPADATPAEVATDLDWLSRTGG